LRLLKQLARRAFSRARANTGNKIAANIEIIAMTTKSSIKVNAARCRFKAADLHISCVHMRYLPQTQNNALPKVLLPSDKAL